MGLEFTGRPDKPGAAAYFISNGTTTCNEQLAAAGNEVDSVLPEDAQVVLLDGRRSEGAEVARFYGITTLPAVLIVMDDDQLYHSWLNTVPMASDVIYMMSQAGVRMRGDQ